MNQKLLAAALMLSGLVSGTAAAENRYGMSRPVEQIPEESLRHRTITLVAISANVPSRRSVCFSRISSKRKLRK